MHHHNHSLSARPEYSAAFHVCKSCTCIVAFDGNRRVRAATITTNIAVKFSLTDPEIREAYFCGFARDITETSRRQKLYSGLA